MMPVSRYRVEERAEVMRVYEIDASNEDEAIEIMFSGTVRPTDLYDIDSVINVKNTSAQKADDGNV